MANKLLSSMLNIKSTLRLVFEHAVSSVNPYNLIEKELKCTESTLSVGSRMYNLNNNVYVVGFGKAVLGMGYQCEIQLGNHLKAGILSIPVGQQNTFKQYSIKENSAIKIYEGAENNVADKKAQHAASQIVDMVKNLTENDIVIVLISGGGSALLPLPIPPVTLEDKALVVQLLQSSGADIGEVNTVRKTLSVIKGGGLLDIAYPAEVIAFILSDIIGDPLDLIASAPTVHNEDAPNKGKLILQKYSLLDKIPVHVKEIIERPVKIVERKTNVHNILIGTNKIALEAALIEAKVHGYEVFILTDVLEGLVSDICLNYIKLIDCICKSISRNMTRTECINEILICKQTLNASDEVVFSIVDQIFSNNTSRLCLLFGGEPTVKVSGNGKGGRSQQLSLEFSCALNKLYSEQEFMKVFNVGLLCAGTDGIDGPTDAAGAVSYNGQIAFAQQQNLDPSHYIRHCDAYTFFSKLRNGEDLIKIGHTGTNVMDVHVLMIESTA